MESVAWLLSRPRSTAPGGRAGRGPRAVVAAGTVAGLVAAFLVATPLSASTAQAAVEDEPDSRVTAVAGEAEALAAAREHGHQVEVLSQRTEYSQTFATPHGTLTVDEYLEPRWVRSGGEWVEADPSLEQQGDGSFRPAAATADMRFSGGGGGPFATIAADDVSVGLGWSTPLPAPEIEGNVATYRDVVPLVDLQVIAGVEGFTHLLVIRSPKALDNPEVQEVDLAADLAGSSLRVADGGAVEAVDGSGRVVFSGPAPTMWDSRDTADSSGDDKEGAGVHGVRVPYEAGAAGPAGERGLHRLPGVRPGQPRLRGRRRGHRRRLRDRPARVRGE